MMMPLTLFLFHVADGLVVPTRRAWMVAAAAAAVPSAAVAQQENTVDLYFGVGCFWHVQHEFAMAEQTILGRSSSDLTARAGYAGGLSVGKDASRPGESLVCYHNLQRVADYGKLGHGEVVGLQAIPESKVADFAAEFAKLFDKRGDRPDKMDLGGEYRSILGLPGGVESPLFPAISEKLPDLTLRPGQGNDPDTLGKKTIWVYDSNKFKFHRAEVYHQFHDGFFPGEDYPRSYNQLASEYYRAGRLEPSGCPDIV